MAPPVKILVIDDEPDTVGLLELTLTTAGYEVHGARSGEEGLHLAMANRYDLLLVDLMMPGMSGFDLMRAIQSKGGQAAQTPIIILTARTRPEDREMGERLGAVGYLIKPATRGQLLDAVRRVLREIPTAK
ncbi:MAG TPA: response regulator [Anaerolineales bacterium]|nr:response regulator [Anaerolineales bacterium]